mgnify:CR=1 FL=1
MSTENIEKLEVLDNYTPDNTYDSSLQQTDNTDGNLDNLTDAVIISNNPVYLLDNTEESTPITYVKSISSVKDKTSDNGNNYSMMRKIFYSHNNNNKQNKFNDSSSYIQNKKMIATGRQSLNNNVVFFTNNNHLEIKQAKRLLRSRGSGIPKTNIQ